MPFYVLWKEVAAPGTVSDAMIDFTDFYASLAELAGADLSADRFVDGVSFAPILQGREQPRREWTQCTYTPYYGRRTVNRRFVRDQNYKLYDDGRFYYIPTDLLEEKPLVEKTAAYQKLESLLTQFPAINHSPEAHQDTATARDVFPEWQKVTE